jgi:hypothetical protein
MNSNFTPTHIGQKLISCKAMTRKEYNDFRGWVLPENEAGVVDDAGYMVEYEPHPTVKPNVDGYAGYISWSPKHVFNDAYKSLSAMSFGDAITMLKRGNKVARLGWNGKGMFLFLVPGSVFKVNRAPLLGIYPEGTEITYHAHIDMKTADDKVVPWLASQTDMIAEDWVLLD